MCQYLLWDCFVKIQMLGTLRYIWILYGYNPYYIIHWIPIGFRPDWIGFRLDWIPIGFRLDSDWIRLDWIGVRLDSDWVPIGPMANGAGANAHGAPGQWASGQWARGPICACPPQPIGSSWGPMRRP